MILALAQGGVEVRSPPSPLHSRVLFFSVVYCCVVTLKLLNTGVSHPGTTEMWLVGALDNPEHKAVRAYETVCGAATAMPHVAEGRLHGRKDLKREKKKKKINKRADGTTQQHCL